jgi:hypothetical protein
MAQRADGRVQLLTREDDHLQAHLRSALCRNALFIPIAIDRLRLWAVPLLPVAQLSHDDSSVVTSPCWKHLVLCPKGLDGHPRGDTAGRYSAAAICGTLSSCEPSPSNGAPHGGVHAIDPE